METAISTLSYLPENKSQSIVFAKKLIDEVLAGVKDPVKIEVQLKILADMIAEVREKIRDTVMNEAYKYGEKEFELAGAKIKASGKTTYDYKACNYSKYDDIIKQKESIEKMLKTLTGPIADVETGETINPPAKKYSPFLRIEL